MPSDTADMGAEAAFAGLSHAAQRLTLPPGGAWGFSAVGPVQSGALPMAIQRAAMRRQRGYASGRRAAAAALQAAGLVHAAPIGIGADHLPSWPKGWQGSISHTDDLAVAVVAPGDPALGIDLERLLPAEVAAEIAPSIMPEAAPGQADMPPTQEVSRVFSAKEALYKALFPQTRQFREFSAARVVWGDGVDPLGLRPLSLHLTEDWGPDWTAGRILRIRQVVSCGHVLSLVWQRAGSQET